MGEICQSDNGTHTTGLRDSGARMGIRNNRAGAAGEKGDCLPKDPSPSRPPTQASRKHAGEMQAIAAAERELHRQARSRLSRQDMEDIIQEAFVRLYSRDDRGGPVANIGAFIRRTVRNLLYDRIRAANLPELVCDEALAGLVDEAASPERILLGRQALDAIAKELERLPESTRTLFLQHRLGSMTLRELAQRYQIPRSTVYEQVRSVMDRLGRAARPYL